MISFLKIALLIVMLTKSCLVQEVRTRIREYEGYINIPELKAIEEIAYIRS